MCQGTLWFHGWTPSSLARHLTDRKVLLHTQQVHHPKEDLDLKEEKNHKKTGSRQRNKFIRSMYNILIIINLYKTYAHTNVQHVVWIKCLVCNSTNVGTSLPQIQFHLHCIVL